MAGIVPLPRQTTQLAAIAWLRGRLFLNAFRRKGARGELIARIVLMPLFGLLALGPVVGAGFGGFYLVSRHEYHFFTYLLWFVFALWMTFVVSTKTAAPTFDLGMLIRFPMRFSTYLIVRLLFGLLDVPTVLCSLALLSAAIGIGIARASLFLPAVCIFLLFTLTVIFFFRMVFLWLDRWFMQRKIREILAGLFFVGILSFQYVNMTFNVGVHNRDVRARHRQGAVILKRVAHTAAPMLRALPPGLAATALIHIAEGSSAEATAPLVCVAAFAAGFLALFSRRLRGEFRGESFNEAPATSTVRPTATGPVARTAPIPAASATPAAAGFLSPTTKAVIGKELRYLVRSQPLLFALVTPIFMVFLIVTRSGLMQRPTDWLLPSTLAYMLLGLAPTMYNILGTEGSGVQLYFLAPIRLREVVLGKNLVSLTLIAIEVVIASTIVLTATAIPPFPVLCATYVWLTFTVTLNLTLGNIRSVYAPRVIDLGKFRQGRQGQLNVLIGLAILLLCLGLGAAALYLAHHLGQPWLPAPIFTVLTAAAIVFYRMNLNHLAQIAQDRRETISAELCRI